MREVVKVHAIKMVLHLLPLEPLRMHTLVGWKKKLESVDIISSDSELQILYWINNNGEIQDFVSNWVVSLWTGYRISFSGKCH